MKTSLRTLCHQKHMICFLVILFHFFTCGVVLGENTHSLNNHPPCIVPINNQYVNEGTTVTFNVSAVDPGGDEITIEALPLEDWMSFDGHTFTAHPEYGDSGLYSISFVASNRDLADEEETILITVDDVHTHFVSENQQEMNDRNTV